MLFNNNQSPPDNSYYFPAPFDTGFVTTHNPQNLIHKPLNPIHATPISYALWYERTSPSMTEEPWERVMNAGVPENHQRLPTQHGWWPSATNEDAVGRSNIPLNPAWTHLRGEYPTDWEREEVNHLSPPRTGVIAAPPSQGEAHSGGSKSTKTKRTEGYLTPGSVSTRSVIKLNRRQAPDTTPGECFNKMPGLCMRTAVARRKRRAEARIDSKGMGKKRK